MELDDNSTDKSNILNFFKCGSFNISPYGFQNWYLENYSRNLNEVQLYLYGSNGDNIPKNGIKRSIKNAIKRSQIIISGSRRAQETGHNGILTYSLSFENSNSNIYTDLEEYRSIDPLKLLKKMEVGIWLTKVTRRKRVRYIFYVKDGAIFWKETKKIELVSIKDIRIGDMASNYKEYYGVNKEYWPNWITIIYQFSTKLKTLHVIADNQDDFKTFFFFLKRMVNSLQEFMKTILISNNELFASVHWNSTILDKRNSNNKHKLTFDDVKNLCDKFYIYASVSHLESIFIQADIDKDGMLNFNEFQYFIQLLKQRKEIDDLWMVLTDNKDKMNFSQFNVFIRDIQKEKISNEAIESLFDGLSSEDSITQDIFLKYLTSEPYIWTDSEDYTRPLNEYFISSSHNTYLIGSQVGATTSVEGYVLALQQGCRCIEVDIWDGDDGPVVCHGILTPSIPLKNVVDVIRKYAFITSPFPLIVSLEIHCKPEYQMITADLFKDLLGPLLYSGCDDTQLLSPIQLKHRIILKCKKSNVLHKIKIGENPLCSVSSNNSCYESEYNFTNNYELKDRTISRLGIPKKVKVIDKLLLLSGIYGLKFCNLSLPESKTPRHCFSLSERIFENFCKDYDQAISINKHNRRFLMRVYPYALRYKSSNFDPIKFWKQGVQFVATNWQTYDLGQQINQAMFRVPYTNNHAYYTGYIRKPYYLLQYPQKSSQIPFILESILTKKLKVCVEILSAQLLPSPKIVKDTSESLLIYTLFEIICDDHGSLFEVDNGFITSRTDGTTGCCRGNGINPIWRTTFKATLFDTKLNFIRFTIKGGDHIIATSCVKLDYMKQGYRHIPLYSTEGERYIFSTLFLKIYYESL